MLSKWTWECPKKNCKSKSKQPAAKYTVGRTGRRHLRVKHNDYKSEPILKKAVKKVIEK